MDNYRVHKLREVKDTWAQVGARMYIKLPTLEYKALHLSLIRKRYPHYRGTKVEADMDWQDLQDLLIF